jgi:hypothetical protein
VRVHVWWAIPGLRKTGEKTANPTSQVAKTAKNSKNAPQQGFAGGLQTFAGGSSCTRQALDIHFAKPQFAGGSSSPCHAHVSRLTATRQPLVISLSTVRRPLANRSQTTQNEANPHTATKATTT